MLDTDFMMKKLAMKFGKASIEYEVTTKDPDPRYDGYKRVEKPHIRLGDKAKNHGSNLDKTLDDLVSTVFSQYFELVEKEK